MFSLKKKISSFQNHFGDGICLEQEFNFCFSNISIYLDKNPNDFWDSLFNMYPKLAVRQVFYKKKIMSNKTFVKEKSQLTNNAFSTASKTRK